MSMEPMKSMEDLIRQDGRYPPEAYAFLHDGLSHAAQTVHSEASPEGPRHVTGQQLCQALRDLAVQRYGLLARTVLSRWKIHGTIDFGNMVYLLIEGGFMKKTDEDSLEDFREVYDFSEAFRPADEFELKE